jgi:hypothetical protein
MGLVLIVWFGGVLTHLLVTRKPLFHPAMIATAAWILVAVVDSIGLVDHVHELSWQTTAFIIGCHAAFMLGIAMIPREKGAPQSAVEPGMASLLLAAVAVAFVMTQAVATLSSGQVPIIGTFANLASARAAHWYGDVSVVHQLARILSYPTIGYCILLPIFWRAGHSLYAMLAGFAFLMLIDMSFAEGGRAALVFTAIAMIFAYLTTRKLTFARAGILTAAGLATMFVLASSFHLARSSNFERSPAAFVRHNCLGGQMGDLVYNSTAPIQALAVSSCYVTVPMRVLNENLQGGSFDHTFGAYNLAIFYDAGFTETREDIAWYYRSAGLAQNPWATSMRDLWIDFWYFAVLAYIPLGAAFGALTRRRYLVTEGQVIRYGCVVVAAALLPFISPLLIRYIVYPVIATWLVEAAVVLFLSKPKKRRRQTRRRVA